MDIGTTCRGNQTGKVSLEASWVTVGIWLDQTNRVSNMMANQVQTTVRIIVGQADWATDRHIGGNVFFTAEFRIGRQLKILNMCEMKRGRLMRHCPVFFSI